MTAEITLDAACNNDRVSSADGTWLTYRQPLERTRLGGLTETAVMTIWLASYRARLRVS
jgi:hypothetical protein